MAKKKSDGIDLRLHIIHPAIVENSDGDEIAKLKKGDVVEYVAHVPKGMVRVALQDGRRGIIHPHSTKELRK